MDIGKYGEGLAALEYQRRGYGVIGRNIRLHGVKQIGELDIIAVKDETVVFVEVKTRTNRSYGWPAEAVNYHKRRKLIRAAKLYLLRNPNFFGWDWRFDVAEVHIDKNRECVNILADVIEDTD